jgi:hypothetical protein
VCGPYDAEWSMSLCWLETRVSAGILRNSSSGRVASLPGACVHHAGLHPRTGSFRGKNVPLGNGRDGVETASVIDGLSARTSAGLRDPVESGQSWRPPPGSETLGGSQRTIPPLRFLERSVNRGISPVGA